MRNASVYLGALLTLGCGAREDAARAQVSEASAAAASYAAPTVAPSAASAVTDDMIGIPPYPGATEVPSMRLAMSTGTGTTYTASYQTTDTPTQVAAFYEAELPKIGTLEESINIGEQMRTVAVRRPDGSIASARAAAEGKNPTIIALYRMIPAKR